MQPISVEQNFESLILRGAVYVDKTEAISNLISMERVFFSRPRRFGKSLTLSTIGTLFEEGVAPYFKGTWIYDKWNEPTYPVLRLNCLDFLVSDYERFVKSFCNEIRDFAKEQKFDAFNPDEMLPAVYMQALFKAMPKRQQIVILVDEYDCCLTYNINNKTEYNRYAEMLRGFYAVLKSSEQIRFLGITGVTRFKNDSIFSIGSNITDATYDHSISQITGYTREEILQYFNEYVQDVVQKINHITLSPADVNGDNPYVKAFLDRLDTEYDGYCFDEDYEQKVYSTWSVNNFFVKNSRTDMVSFGDYWFDNGGMPSILKNYLETHDLDVFTCLRNDVISPDPEEFTSPIVNSYVLILMKR